MDKHTDSKHETKQKQPQKNQHGHKNFQSLQDLESLKPDEGVLNFELLRADPSKKQIEVDKDEINQTLQIIQNAKINKQLGVNERPQFDPTQNSKIKLSDLKTRILAINPTYPVNELNSLFNNKNEISNKDLYELLNDNQINNLDPFEESLKFFCKLNEKDGTMVFDVEHASQLMGQLGYGELDMKDKQILEEILDIDQNKQVTMDDLIDTFSYINNKNHSQQVSVEHGSQHSQAAKHPHINIEN